MLEPNDIEAMNKNGGIVTVQVRGFASSLDTEGEIILFTGNVLLEDVKQYVKSIEGYTKDHFNRDT
jgi:hypothetical protein